MAYTTIDDPTIYFNTKLYTGNGTDATGITGVGFQPDMTWIKERSQVRSHVLFDVIRGATVQLNPNDTAADATVSSSLQSFDSDGFTVGTATSVNQSSETYVSWNWLANGSGSLNEVGDINSTVSANTTSGFSIVSYTGNATASQTVGHGLSTAPKMIIFKTRDGVTAWVVYHKSVGATKGLFLNTNGTGSTVTAYFQDTDPTSSVFSLGTDADTNGSSKAMIAYCFADVQGYSKFGSYIGNGSADGTFVYTGMKPAFIMIKRTDAVNNWIMLNNKMSLYNNNTGDEIYADQSAAQNSFVDGGADFLSNGFKLRGTNASVNFNGGTYIYMTFAENPFVTGASAIPTTAR